MSFWQKKEKSLCNKFIHADGHYEIINTCMQRKVLKQLCLIYVPKCFEILIIKNTTFIFLICIATVYISDFFHV
jgi:hypothetical protein